VPSASYFRKQAEICRQLSRTCFDLTVAGRLRELADEFTARAVELEAAEMPAGVLRQAAGATDEVKED
jgi:hypothetical protein